MAFFDEQGRPTRHKDGYARCTARYDERGNITEMAFFDEAGQPTRHKDGYTRLTKEYDEEGALLNSRYYGIDGDPITTHLMAEEIVPGGQAKAIGLEPGDIILSYDGKDGLNRATFIRAVQAPGEGTRELRILRRGEVLTFQVQPGKLGIRLVDRAMQGEKTPSP